MRMTLNCYVNRNSIIRCKPSYVIALTALLFTILPASTFAIEEASVVEPEPLWQVDPTEKIVNGELSWAFPSVVDIVLRSGNFTLCSGTLIGCQTVLTAAHCVCFGNTAESCGTPDPADFRIFGQNFGFANVSSVTVNPNYEFGVTSDFAIMTLEEPVSGIGPTAINTEGKPAVGSPGRIAGYGITDGNSQDSGLLRTGLVTTTSCEGVPDAGHVCWNFEEPLGNPGENSNTCSGDSGGPLFVDFGSGAVVAGVTSGGFSADCLPVDESFDADVFGAQAWIESVAGSDLNNSSCGLLASAGTPDSPVLANGGILDNSNTREAFSFDVGADVETLRVTLNGEDEQNNDFDLYVKFGSPPVPPDDFDCRSLEFGTYEECELPKPSTGTWHILAERFEGAGEFQVSATLLGALEDDGGGGCTADTNTLCLLDNRFQVQVEWRDMDGNTGVGNMVGTTPDSGLVYFFDSENWEFLVKMVDACTSEFNSFWVFSAACTDVEYTLTVTDTQSGEVKTYFNPLGNASMAITDTKAFLTCP